MREPSERCGRCAWGRALLALSLFFGIGLCAGEVSAQAPPVEIVPLSPGTSPVTQSGLLDSRTRDDQAYVFRGSAGQVLEIELRSSNPAVSFDVLPKGDGPALVNSAITGESHWTGRLMASGDYTVRVYLKRSAARRGVTASYWLSLGLRGSAPAPAQTLAGTTWQLVRFQSSDERTLYLGPGQREKYTLAFGSDGRVALRADCNRGHSTWSSGGDHEVSFGALAMTRAACAPGSMHDRFVKDMPYVRSYVLRAGRLYLSLVADGGIYEFEPVSGAAPEAASPSFDCTRITKVVEQRICADPRLAARDNQLAKVYAESVRRSGGSPEPWLVTSQREFMTRRDACAESDDQQACLERVYDERSAEVQVKGGLVARRAPIVFACSDPRGAPERISAVFHQSEPPSVTLERARQSVFAVAGPAGSGLRYQAPSVVFWEKDQEAQVNWWGAELRCAVRYP